MRIRRSISDNWTGSFDRLRTGPSAGSGQAPSAELVEASGQTPDVEREGKTCMTRDGRWIRRMVTMMKVMEGEILIDKCMVEIIVKVHKRIEEVPIGKVEILNMSV